MYTLSLYASESLNEQSNEPVYERGVFPLLGSEVVDIEDDSNTTFAFTLTHPAQSLLKVCAETQMMKEKWLVHLRQAMLVPVSAQTEFDIEKGTDSQAEYS